MQQRIDDVIGCRASSTTGCVSEWHTSTASKLHYWNCRFFFFKFFFIFSRASDWKFPKQNENVGPWWVRSLEKYSWRSATVFEYCQKLQGSATRIWDFKMARMYLDLRAAWKPHACYSHTTNHTTSWIVGCATHMMICLSIYAAKEVTD